jgi:formate hydrogenlyase subunit 6/NADH:ubiquinone oxidoreductase subunit I
LAGLSTAFANYWRTIWKAIATCAGGLRVTWKYLFSKPFTVEYPYVVPEIQGFRGLHAFERDRCIRCRMCERVCPIGCIAIDLEGKGKEAAILKYEVDYGTCLFCNLCVEVCPVDCIWLTADWDLASYRREDARVRFEGRDPEEERKKLWPETRAAREAKGEKTDKKPAPAGARLIEARGPLPASWSN